MAVWQIIDKIIQPFKTVNDRLESLETKIYSNTGKIEKDFSALQEQEKINMMLLKSCSLLLQHCADENHTGQLKEQSKVIDDFLFTKGGKV